MDHANAGIVRQFCLDRSFAGYGSVLRLANPNSVSRHSAWVLAGIEERLT
jgi:hypothetical protein